MHDWIIDEYFNWLCEIVCKNRVSDQITYTKLLTYLHNTAFRYSIQRDENRAEDGIELRYKFAYEKNLEHYPTIKEIESALSGPCSVLEMMVALALRCEHTIMDDAKVGDRTRQWFWGMCRNIGLGGMRDGLFDKMEAEEIINRFLDRQYEPNGKGGLFTIRGCDTDLRRVEIWHQLCWYLDSIT